MVGIFGPLGYVGISMGTVSIVLGRYLMFGFLDPEGRVIITWVWGVIQYGGGVWILSGFTTSQLSLDRDSMRALSKAA